MHNITSHTPRSMVGPMNSLGLFKRTKASSWNFDGRGARSKTVRDLAVTIDIEKTEEKTVRLRFNPKTKTYKLPSGRLFFDLEECKISARFSGFTCLKMGAVKIKL